MGCCSASPKKKKQEEEAQWLNAKRQSSKALSPGNFATFSKKPFEQEYQILKVLGEGAYGSVNLVKHLPTGLERAAKEMVITQGVNYEEIFEEVDIMKEMDHPNIIRVLEIFNLETRVIIVLELCTGGEMFDKIIEEGLFSENRAAKYMLEVVSAMNYLHGMGIIHRDLKPENLLLESKSPKASVKLADFGTATHIEEGQKLDLQIGSCYYIAPEVIKGSYDQKCDVWSMGVILFVMLCGNAPFNGKDEDAIHDSILKNKLEFRQRAWTTVSKEAQDLVSKMLQKNPKKRVSFQEVLEHPWIKSRANNEVPDKPIALESLKKLNNFNIKSKMMNATLAFISSQLLKQEEISELKRLFEQMDNNRDGKLSWKELENGMAKYGISSGRNIQDLMDMCDIDGDGFVNYNEFIIATTDWSKKLSEDQLYEAFKVYDVNGDGNISLEEIKNVLMDEGESEHYFLEMMKEIDRDGNGEIDFQEFYEYMMNTLGNKNSNPPSNRI